jgi:hypothetical protein
VGGNTVPLVAARRPVRHLVYLCALVPEIGRSLVDQGVDEPDTMNPAWLKGVTDDAQGRAAWVDLDLARTLLYADCDEPTAEAAVNRLRPEGRYNLTVPSPLAEFPPVGCTYVICVEDQMVGPAWSKRVARDKLGAKVIELPGSHSPFLSRPSALADVLLHLADT